MARTKAEKKKAKRKVKQKERRQRQADFFKRDKFDYLLNDAAWCRDGRQLNSAFSYLEEALRLAPENGKCRHETARLAHEMKRPDIELKALLGLYANTRTTPEQIGRLCDLLKEKGRYGQALTVIQKTLPLIEKSKGQKNESAERLPDSVQGVLPDPAANSLPRSCPGKG